MSARMSLMSVASMRSAMSRPPDLRLASRTAGIDDRQIDDAVDVDVVLVPVVGEFLDHDAVLLHALDETVWSAQTRRSPNLSPASLAACGATIMPARSVSCAISGAYGVLRTMRMVSGSTMSTWSIDATSALRVEPGMVRWRSSEYLAASASNGSPSWNLTPGRSLIVTVFPSADVSCDQRELGTTLKLLVDVEQLVADRR